MSRPANIASQPKKAPASSGAKDLTGSFRRRPMVSAISRAGTPSSATALYTAPVSALSEGESVEASDIGTVRRRPTVTPLADIGEDALFPSDRDPRANEPLPLRVMNLGQANHGCLHPIRGEVGGRLFGSRAGDVVGGDRGGVL